MNQNELKRALAAVKLNRCSCGFASIIVTQAITQVICVVICCIKLQGGSHVLKQMSTYVSGLKDLDDWLAGIKYRNRGCFRSKSQLKHISK